MATYDINTNLSRLQTATTNIVTTITDTEGTISQGDGLTDLVVDLNNRFNTVNFAMENLIAALTNN
jgi:hypothetical protein